MRRWSSILALALLAILLPAQVLAAGETYTWKDPNHSAVVGSGGGFGSNQATLAGSNNRYHADITCADGASGTVDLTANGDQGSVSSSCIGFDSQAAIKPVGTSPSGSTPDPAKNTRCKASGGFGYIICPAYSFLLGVIDDIETNVIVPFLKVDPIKTADTSTPTYQIWSAMRGLANGLFVIAFLVVIFHNVLSIGLDNYSIKKLLPRLIVASILSWFSYLLVAFAIDVTNITGAGIGSLMLSPIAGHPVAAIDNLTAGLGVAGGIAGVVAVAGSIVTGSILVVLIGAFFTVITIFVTLVARQILITFLLVVGPLAFAAWLLPSTEHLFTLWHKTLTRLLLMYPMIVMLFAAGKLFGAAAVASSGGGAGNSSIRSLLSVMATLVPLFLIPLTFRFAGSAMQSIHNLVRNLRGGAQAATENSDRFQRMKDRAAHRKRALASGTGVPIGFGEHKLTFGANMGGAMLGRGAYGGWWRTKSNAPSNVKAMLQFAQNRNTAIKKLEDEKVLFETYMILSRGIGWANKEIGKAQAQGDFNKVATMNEAIGQAKYEGRINDAAFRAAGATKMKDTNLIQDDDRTGILEWQGNNAANRLIANQVWRDVREGVRKQNPTLTFTNLDGTPDDPGRIKWLMGQNQATLSGFTVDAFEKMRDEGSLAAMAQTEGGRRTIAGLLGGGGPQAGPNQQQIIRSALQGPLAMPDPRDTALPGGTATFDFAEYDPATRSISLVSRERAQYLKDSGQGHRVIQVNRAVPELEGD